MADFVNALCDWIADPARADLERETAPFELFAHAAEETDAGTGDGGRNFTDPYAVVRAYGGRAQASDPTRDQSLQVYVVGRSAAAAMELAQEIYESLLAKQLSEDDGNTPVQNVQLEGWLVIAIRNLRQPGLIGRDAQQRAEVVFNFEAAFRAA